MEPILKTDQIKLDGLVLPAVVKEPSAASKMLRNLSIVHQTQQVVSTLNEKNKGIAVDNPALKITEVTKIPLPAQASLEAEPPLGAETAFKVGDIVQAKLKGHGETFWTGLIMAPLSTVFKEADTNGDGKTTYEEWQQRLGHLVEADVLKQLFDECDTNKDGMLDVEEFTIGLEGKYEIKWAQDPQQDCIKDVKELRLAPDPDTFRKEVAQQKAAKDTMEKDKANLQKMLKDVENEQQQQQSSSGDSASIRGMLCLAVCVFVLVLAVPIMYIAFSQNAKWMPDGSNCDDKNPEHVCTCREKFPVYMLVSGSLQIVFWILVMLGAALMGMGSPGAGGGLLGCSACCIGIPLMVINIMMFVNMFESDKHCGSDLWVFGVVMLVIGICQGIGGQSSVYTQNSQRQQGV